MTEPNAPANLLSWCSERGFWIDPSIQIISGPCGVAVVSQDSTIPEDRILVRIPRESVLSVKSSPISVLIPPRPYGRGAQLSLALALSVELVIGATSPWFPYLQSLPREIPGIPLFWGRGVENQQSFPQNGDPLEWLNGTEAWKMLFDSVDSDSSLVSEIDEYFHEVAEPVYAQVFESSPEKAPSSPEFYHAYSLVSSRSFLVDSYNGLSMVPIADAFNHTHDNHVHLESDFHVCPECGSLQRCVHDDATEPAPRSMVPDDADNFYEMVSNLSIPPHSEVFNTYGETLTNAQLLVQYGFILDGNDNDHLTWTFDELAQFSEHHLLASGSWTWDSIGGLPQFRDLLRSINSRPWERISESELVYLDRTHQFSLNGDAAISHGLWLFFALLLVCLRNTPPNHSRNLDSLVVLLEETLQCQLTLETSESTNHADDDDTLFVPPSPGHSDQQQRPSPYGVILELGRLLASLCRARSARTGRAGVEMAELGEILDRLPNDMTPTKMAISLAMTERSLLDSCMSAWDGFADGALGQA
ncbi:hypothetical protein C8F04DRAFT_1119455 [Mycena alexandri]|uniref:SET domain-containing protein n=1 Tax=Mycena alexandri TaxID=1745969 RepID=A0AAD6SJN1_9AGAR|nr:hypothetical protein C8F04DRAFT_1119455 [Mycena alexandri]